MYSKTLPLLCVLLSGSWLNSASAVEPLDDSGLSAFHLIGLDAPAAGSQRSAVYDDVSERNVKVVNRKLTQAKTLSENDDPQPNDALIKTTTDNSDTFNLRSVAGQVEFRRAEVNLSSPISATGGGNVQNIRSDLQVNVVSR